MGFGGAAVPVIGVPVIARPDLLRRLLDSINEPTWEVMVIDNSDGREISEACAGFDVTLVVPGANLGVAASWNHVIRTRPSEPWWAFANADTELGRGDLRSLASEMAKGGPRWVGMNGDWRLMGLSAEAVEAVGMFDENYHPIYCEDADYEYRCRLAGVPAYPIEGSAKHTGSAVIRSEARYGEANARTYPANVAYFEAKWGGRLRGGERYTRPFDDPGRTLRDWTLDLSRLRLQGW